MKKTRIFAESWIKSASLPKSPTITGLNQRFCWTFFSETNISLTFGRKCKKNGAKTPPKSRNVVENSPRSEKVQHSGTALQLSGAVNPAIQSHNHRKPGIANPVPQSNNNCTPGTTNPAPQSHKPKLAFPRGCLKKAKNHGRNAPETLLSVHFRGIQS